MLLTDAMRVFEDSYAIPRCFFTFSFFDAGTAFALSLKDLPFFRVTLCSRYLTLPDFFVLLFEVVAFQPPLPAVCPIPADPLV